MAFRSRPGFLVVSVLASVLAAGYAGAVGYLKLNERAFIFHPAARSVAAVSNPARAA